MLKLSHIRVYITFHQIITTTQTVVINHYAVKNKLLIQILLIQITNHFLLHYLTLTNYKFWKPWLQYQYVPIRYSTILYHPS